MTKQFSLSSILDKFKDAHDTVDKVASEEVVEAAAPIEKVAEVTEVAEVESVKELSDADVLKGIAKEASDAERSATTKEASEFGKLFAHSFMEELEMEGTIKQASEGAYAATIQALQEADLNEKLASVFDEANYNTKMALIESSSYTSTCEALEKQASDDFMNELPMMLLGATQEAYDHTIQVLQNGE